VAPCRARAGLPRLSRLESRPARRCQTRWQLDPALCVALAGGSHTHVEVAKTMIKAQRSWNITFWSL
ncbi:MAG: hypothetical protein KAU38_15195, partial [Desulfobacterales bacterium]|nr:hypothetical protein [Desulfobacterales bacterium]